MCVASVAFKCGSMGTPLGRLWARCSRKTGDAAYVAWIVACMSWLPLWTPCVRSISRAACSRCRRDKDHKAVGNIKNRATDENAVETDPPLHPFAFHIPRKFKDLKKTKKSARPARPGSSSRNLIRHSVAGGAPRIVHFAVLFLSLHCAVCIAPSYF